MELDLRSIPRITVRPQQISTVFSNLVQNTVEGLTGAALVWLTTCQAGPQVQIVVRDDGRDISAEELASIFDPSFKVKSGRVATGNWGLFSCLQIIGEHGGEIEIQSAPGHGD